MDDVHRRAILRSVAVADETRAKCIGGIALYDGFFAPVPTSAFTAQAAAGTESRAGPDAASRTGKSRRTEPVELDEVVRECLDAVADCACKRGIELCYKPGHSERAGADVRVDHVRFRQVLLQLLSNAVKYNRDGGRVLLTWRSGTALCASGRRTDPACRTYRGHLRCVRRPDLGASIQNGVVGRKRTGIHPAASREALRSRAYSCIPAHHAGNTRLT